jgi:hypothetical protein
MVSIAIAKVSPTRQHAIVLFMLTFLHHRTLEVGYLDLRRTEWPFSIWLRRNAKALMAMARMFCTRSDELRKNPIIGTVGCCAATASGHVAAPPRSVTNLRRTGNSP